MAGFLETGEHPVGLGEATGNALGLHGAAGDDAVAVEQEPGGDGRPAGGIGLECGQQ